MTDNDIIKAFENMLKNFDGKVSDFEAIASAIDLINRQKAEIERLTDEKENLRCVIEDLSNNTEYAKAEAVKEFAERLKEIITMSPKNSILIDKWYIDNLVKEMVGAESD